MAPHVELDFQPIGRMADEKLAARRAALMRRIGIVVAALIGVALLLVAEWRLPYEQRMGFFEATYVSP